MAAEVSEPHLRFMSRGAERSEPHLRFLSKAAEVSEPHLRFLNIGAEVSDMHLRKLKPYLIVFLLKTIKTTRFSFTKNHLLTKTPYTMIDLNRYYENVFFPLETNEGNFVEGTDRHIALFETNNPGGIYTSLIATTKNLRDALKAAISARDSEGTEQEGSTILMNNAFAAFQQFVRIREGLIRSTFEGDNTPQYEEFFPQGLTEYTNATLGTIETLMDRMVTKATKYELELGVTFKNDCIAKRTAFLNARAAQVTNLAESNNLQAAVGGALFEMAEQLTINLLTTASNNVGKSSTADLYFDQRFFVRPEQSGIYTGQNAPGQTKTVRSQGWSPTKALSVTNTGTTDFYIGFANAEGVPITSGELVAASQTREFTAAGLGYATGMSYLNVTGADGTGAKWRVELQ
jgi:hypothetical protein